ncbi:MAG: peptidylprolyl isomerase [Bacteroidetes bacterium]|nr:MAG: peptidylprolyl isomerase [Bacteroidota bacterium]
MQIKNGNLITLNYKLYIDSPAGELIEETESDDPYTFIIGSGEQLEAFEKNILGLNTNDPFSFGISADEAYGQIDEKAIVSVPKTAFEHEGKIDESIFKMHKVLPMKDGDGNEFQGVIIAIGEEDITMDFNHPLAGEDIWFDGEVVEVKAVN